MVEGAIIGATAGRSTKVTTHDPVGGGSPPPPLLPQSPLPPPPSPLTVWPGPAAEAHATAQNE